MWDIVYLVIVSALCIIWLTRMTMDVGLAELLCGLWNVMFEVDSLNIWNEFNPLRIGLNWVNYLMMWKIECSWNLAWVALIALVLINDLLRNRFFKVLEMS